MTTHVPPAPPVVDGPPAAPPSPAAVAEGMAALRDAIASQRLEGLEPSATVTAALERVVHGELTIDDVIDDIHARIEAVRRGRGEV